MSLKRGISYREGRARLSRIHHTVKNGKAKNPQLAENLKKSILNQVKLGEGGAAVSELKKDVYSKSTYSGSSNRSHGYCFLSCSNRGIGDNCLTCCIQGKKLNFKAIELGGNDGRRDN